MKRGTEGHRLHPSMDHVTISPPRSGRDDTGRRRMRKYDSFPFCSDRRNILYFPFTPTGVDGLGRCHGRHAGNAGRARAQGPVARAIAWVGISDRIRQLSRDAFRIGQGSLYPALHRYERDGWVTSYWRTTENNRLARYYELTPPGRRALSATIARWRA